MTVQETAELEIAINRAFDTSLKKNIRKIG